MKKLVVLMLTLSLTFAMVGCGQSDDAGVAGSSVENESTDAASVEESTDESTEDASEEADEVVVMSHDEYIAAAIEDAVVVETYVQAKQSWWEDKATIYTQAEDGAYFIYNMPCSKEDYDKLTVGTKIRVSGYTAEFSGEIEIADVSSFEILEGNYVAEALDVTALLGTDELINHQNEFVSFKGMTVEASTDADGNEVAYLYKWNGSGQDGDDLYFNVSVNGQTYTFTVESYLCDNTTDVYTAVKNLKIGDKIDMEGFLYWYEGVNPHITSVTAAN